ncbi:MAG TPA: hypothetical protein IAB17_00630 [Candidatus Alectryocaccobium stercorigallinarum]|nr:hypothetical protein [Candidatus Alectryocaccobium stercorigallinarum]
MQKSTFLKVMGILCIIFGAIGILSGLVNMAMYMWIGMGGFAVVCLLQSIFMLVAGIMGVMHCANKQKAAGCLVWGLIVVILAIISLIMYNASDIASLVNYASAAVGVPSFNFLTFLQLVVPILYFVSAFRFVRK